MNRLNKIIPHISNKRCALFIGAGLSRIAGCQDWDTMIEGMLDDPSIREDQGIKKKISMKEKEL